MGKVLIVATSHKTQGGISSVINAHKKGEQWDEFHCKWIETSCDGSVLKKIWYLITAMLLYIIILPFFDIIHIHHSEYKSTTRKIPFVFFAKLFKKQVIVHFHSFSPETTIKGPWTNRYKYMFTKADVVIVLSEYWKREVNSVYHLGDKVIVLYNPCCIWANQNAYHKKKQILYAGAINKRKGYSDLIKAFVPVSMLHPDWFLVIAGSGDVVSARNLTMELGMEDKISFPGWLSGKEKDMVFKESSIFCLPSYAEGFPMAVLDAWSYGLPVITTPVGGITDVAKDGDNVLLFSPGDIEQLTICLEKLVSDDELREKLHNKSIELSEKTFNICNINKQLRELYCGLLRKKS